MLSAVLDFSPLLPVLCSSLKGVQAVYLFGSAATGDEHSESDVDLAVLTESRLDPVVRWELQERLAALVGRDVDLVDLRSASAVMRVEALRSSILLHDADPQARALFEALALSDYARLQEERKGILDDVRARGSI